MKLTKIQKVYIESERNKLPLKQIAKDLGLTLEDVTTYVANLPALEVVPVTTEVPVSTSQPAPEPFEVPNVKNMIINPKDRKRPKGVVVMNEAASFRADETRIDRIGSTRNGDHIFKIDPTR